MFLKMISTLHAILQGGGGEIRVLDLNGTLKRRVPIDKNSSPYDITLSPTGEKIFFTDNKIESVTCMTIDGRIIYQYRDKKFKGREAFTVMQRTTYLSVTVIPTMYTLLQPMARGVVLCLQRAMDWKAHFA